MASIGAIWGPPTLRLLRVTVARTTKAIRHRIANSTRPLQEGQPITVRSGNTGRQPIHPAALLKQQKRGARWFSSATAQNVNRAIRRYLTSEASPQARSYASRFPSSNTGRRVAQSGGRAPWATTLRPNLTGGAMPRTAGGYSLGGGARYFSHTPAAPAQVVQNVSQAMRAFFLSGQKLRYDGLDSRGNRQYRAVSVVEDEAMRKLAAIPRSAPGAFIDFHLSPTVTALSPLAAALSTASSKFDLGSNAPSSPTLNADGFLDVLSADFGRALKDLTTVYADLQRLAVLGDLPVEMQENNTLRVRFPGVDAHTLHRLCDDIDLERGVIRQDPDFDASAGVSVALKFPFAPDAERTMTSPGGSARSLDSCAKDDISSLEDDSFVHDAFIDHVSENPWLSESEHFQTMSPPSSSADEASHVAQSYEGLEGIYKFLAECERAQGRVG